MTLAEEVHWLKPIRLPADQQPRCEICFMVGRTTVASRAVHAEHGGVFRLICSCDSCFNHVPEDVIVHSIILLLPQTEAPSDASDSPPPAAPEP